MLPLTLPPMLLPDDLISSPLGRNIILFYKYKTSAIIRSFYQVRVEQSLIQHYQIADAHSWAICFL